MDPYTPPRSSPDSEPVDEDEALGGPRPVVGLAGAAMGGAGILSAAAGWQLGDMLIALDWWVEAWMWSFVPLGLGLAVCGGGFTQARGWALVPGAAAAAICALSGGAWLVWAALHGAFTLASLTGTALSLVAAALGFVALPEAQRVARARHQLMGT